MSIDTTQAPLRSDNVKSLPVPPHSRDAEQSTLGALMLDNSKWDDIYEIVDADAFYIFAHRRIFSEMAALALSDKPIDVVTVSERLEQQGLLESIGGLEYLAELARNTPSAANIVAYARIVLEHRQRRLLINVGRDLSQHAVDGQQTSRELIEATERQLFVMADGHQCENQSIRSALTSAIESIDRAYSAKDGITGTPTGFKDLDTLTCGWQPTDLIIIAARPSMGKTTLGMNTVEHALMFMLRNEGSPRSPVFVFSMEMSKTQLVQRFLASLGRLDLNVLRSGKLGDEDWPKLTAATNQFLDFEGHLFIDDSSGITATALMTRARRMARRNGKPALILIDYLQLLTQPGCENRNNEISAISRILKAMAKDLSCPVIALSQLNRSLESRPNKRPIMADLRDSGAIEQDADVIAFIHREEVYKPDDPELRGRAELIIGKQRNGPVGVVNLSFLASNNRFESLAQPHYMGVNAV